MILQSDFPPDIRVEKEAKSLIESGNYNIFLFCNNSRKSPRFDRYAKINIFRLPYYNLLNKMMNRLKNFPLWFNPIWLLNGFLITKKVKPAIIHVHDLPLVFLGLILSRVFGTKLIYDMHENYPATFDLWKKGGILRFIIRNKKLAIWYDKFSQKKADGVIIIEPEHQKWVEYNYQISREMTVVSNTVEYEYYRKIKPETDILSGYSNRFIISYVGMVSVERNLDVALQAIYSLKEQIPEILFFIVGDGPNLSDLKKLANSLNLKDHVVFTGWVDFDLTKSYIHISDVCVITRSSNAWADTTTPHKLYQYMALGKPIVASDAAAVKRIVEETKCGEIFKSGDVNSFTAAIMKMYKSDVREYGLNGKMAAKQTYNWENSSKSLLKLYDKLIR